MLKLCLAGMLSLGLVHIYMSAGTGQDPVAQLQNALPDKGALDRLQTDLQHAGEKLPGVEPTILYRWRDAQGVTHLSDQPPEGVPEVERIVLAGGTPQQPVPAEGEEKLQVSDSLKQKLSEAVLSQLPGLLGGEG